MDKTSIKREYKPKEWKIVSGDPIECIDVEELDAHNVSLIKHRNYDGNGVPYRTLVNFNFKNNVSSIKSLKTTRCKLGALYIILCK